MRCGTIGKAERDAFQALSWVPVAGSDAAQGITHAGGVVAIIRPFTEGLFIEAKGEMSDQGQVTAVRNTIV